jgi:hypothetical protein
MPDLAEWLLDGLLLMVAAGMAAWVAGAIYFDVGQGANWGRWATVAWVVGVIVLFVLWQPPWQPFLVLLVLVAAFLGWWFRQKPSHDRDWDPAVAVLPRAVRQGDAVTLEHVRNFEYRTLTDFTPRYDTRTVHLANLAGVDVIFFNWGSRWMSHPVLVFDFGPDGRVGISIEVRYRRGQGFAILRSCYRQQEMIFVVADERDLILRRTKYGPSQDARLYRLAATAEQARVAFLDFVGAVDRLYETPRWYHGLCANCTTTFYRLPNMRYLMDWRVVANSRLDRALYEAGMLDRSVPFADLWRVARINEIANAAPETGFGDYVRRELEARRHDR